MGKDSEDFYLIFEDGDPMRAEMIRAALEAGEIDCFVKNEGVQNLFALGSLGGINPLLGTVKVYVRHEDRERAEALLNDLQDLPEPGEAPAPDAEIPPPAAGEKKGFLSNFRKWFRGD